LGCWEQFDEEFFVEVDQAFVLRLKSVLYGEEVYVKNLAQHGNVRLLGVFGRRVRRERMLGYIVEFVGSPIIHGYTWFLALSYTAATDVRRKPLRYLFTDENIRLARAGIGVEEGGMQKFDYWVGYRDKDRQHDEEGAAGSVAIHTSGGWRAGL